MKYEIVTVKEKLVEGIAITTTNENGKAMKDIGQLWQQFFGVGVYAGIEHKVNTKTIGLYTEYEGDYTKPYVFMTCTEIREESANMENKVTKVIPEGKYAKFVITGDVQKAVGELWGSIWQMNLDRKYNCDFEEYQEIREGQEPEIHVYISLN